MKSSRSTFVRCFASCPILSIYILYIYIILYIYSKFFPVDLQGKNASSSLHVMSRLRPRRKPVAASILRPLGDGGFSQRLLGVNKGCKMCYSHIYIYYIYRHIIIYYTLCIIFDLHMCFIFSNSQPEFAGSTRSRLRFIWRISIPWGKSVPNGKSMGISGY